MFIYACLSYANYVHCLNHWPLVLSCMPLSWALSRRWICQNCDPLWSWPCSSNLINEKQNINQMWFFFLSCWVYHNYSRKISHGAKCSDGYNIVRLLRIEEPWKFQHSTLCISEKYSWWWMWSCSSAGKKFRTMKLIFLLKAWMATYILHQILHQRTFPTIIWYI